MNNRLRKFGFVLGILFLSVRSAIASPEVRVKSDYDSIERRIAKDGPRKALESMMNSKAESDFLLSGIASGKKGWLVLFPALRNVSDGAWAELLDQSLGMALNKNPLDALRAIDSEHAFLRQRDAQLHIETQDYSSVCGMTDKDFQDEAPNPQLLKRQAIRLLKDRSDKVTQCREPGMLTDIKRQCLVHIADAINEWRVADISTTTTSSDPLRK